MFNTPTAISERLNSSAVSRITPRSLMAPPWMSYPGAIAAASMITVMN